VYYRKRPNARYTEIIARQLFGIAAHESMGFRATRQFGYDWKSTEGAFGLWQVETSSVIHTYGKLRHRPQIEANASAWLFRHPSAAGGVLDKLNLGSMMRLMMGWDELACFFARCHLLWDPEPIPESIEDQAGKWDEVYNRNPNAGFPGEYLLNWSIYCAPILGAEYKKVSNE